MDFILHPENYLEALGPVGMFVVFAIIFAESGLFFGFFFPGDSLLLTAGLVAFKGIFNIWALVIGVFIAAVLGDNVGFWFGNKVGPPIFSRPQSRFFKPQYLQRAKEFYDRYGGITIILARFLPVIRTFVPIAAGAAAMDYRRFFAFNLIGGFLWGVGVPTAGYLLGALIPPQVLDRYFTYIVLAAFFIPGLPTVWHVWKENRTEIIPWVKGLLTRKPTAATADEETES